MRSLALGALVLALASLAPAPAAAQRSAPAEGAFPVRAGTTLEPDTVRVGDPFLVRVRIQAPAGSRIVFPEPPDSTGTVQAIDPVRIDSTSVAAGIDQTATYRVAAWDIDDQPIRLGEVVVRNGTAERRVSLGRLTIFVRSVLPLDSARRVPKPARPIFEFTASRWWIWAILAAVAVAAALLFWWWRRRRRRPVLMPGVDPFVRAERDFTRIEKLGLIEAGERGRFVALMVEVLRDYLAARYENGRLSLTSTELVVALRGRRALPHDRLRRVLDEADLVKFARRPLTAERARDLGREARAIVAHEHGVSKPLAEAAA